MEARIVEALPLRLDRAGRIGLGVLRRLEGCASHCILFECR